MKHLASALIVMFLAACSEPAPPPAPEAAPVAEAKPKAAPTVTVKAPSGTYALDPNHSSVSFSVVHLGLAPYVMEFTGKQAVLELNASDLSKSKISLTVDAASLRTNFMGDYKATHEGTPYSSFEEALSKDPKFLNAKEHPEITFESTSVTVRSKKKLQVTGNLGLRGQTHPLTFDVKLTGSVAQHPWTKKGAVGFSATGQFLRSKYGIEAMLQPLLISDAVTVTFNGEFHQQASAEPEAEEAGDDAAAADDSAAGEAAADEGASDEPSEADYE